METQQACSFEAARPAHAGVMAMLIIGLLITMMQPRLAAAGDATDQIVKKRLFAEPLTWVGDEKPAEAESVELMGVIGVFETNGASAGFVGLEKFLTIHPDSRWAPSLQVNMAEYYRSHGHYSLALTYWQAAWDATKTGQDAASQKIAARAIAGWTRLLASLGEKEKLNALFKELQDRHLPLGVYATTIDETKEGLAMMNAKPGVSYRCGSFALGHMALALGMDRAVCQRIFKVDSPDGGFYLSQLMELARTNGMAVAVARRPLGAELVVPCVVHWKLNHYAAITAKKGNLYQVEDPTFEVTILMDAGTIESEAGGEFILPKDRVPVGWQKLTATECANIYGKGFPQCLPGGGDSGPPGGCPPDGDDDSESSTCDPPAANDGAGSGGTPPPPPCPDCGMPQWSVTEPYITLWLKDTPLLYRQSSGKWMKLTLSYKSRGLAQNTSSAGFGDKWSCNWLGTLQTQTNSDTVTDNRAGGGVEGFNVSGAPSYKSARTFQMFTLAGIGNSPAIAAPSGALNLYAHAVAVGMMGDTTNYFLTHRVDQYGRTLKQFIYQDVGSLTLVTNVLDMDGLTNTLAYGNTSFPYLITAVTDPYNRTAYFNYDGSGLLTNIIDAQGISTCFQYDTDEHITNMVTLYGTNSFQYFDGTNYAGTPRRSLVITEASGDQQLYAYTAVGPEDNGYSYHWNRAQYAAMNSDHKTNVLDLPSADYKLASAKAWVVYAPGGLETTSDTLHSSSPAGVARRWTAYQYQGGGPGNPDALNRVTEIQLPSGLALSIGRNSLGRPTSFTYDIYNYASSHFQASYTNIFDASGTILQYELGPRGELTRGYGYDPVITNLLVSVTNAANDVLRYSHEAGTLKMTSITFPGGLVRTNIYYTSGPNKGFLMQQIDIGFRTNSFAYTNGNLWMQTNELGLVTAYTYDNLNRLVSTAYPDNTTISNVYDKLDIVATKDRLNQWIHYGYNNVRQLMAETNVSGQVTTYDYCSCGAPDTITRWNGSTPFTTTFRYDLNGLMTNVLYKDGYQLFYAYDDDDRVYGIADNAGNELFIGSYLHGLTAQPQTIYLNSQTLLNRQFDEYGRITNSVDRNIVTTAQSYDFLDRLITRQSFGSDGTQTGQEHFDYSPLGMTNYVDQLGHPTVYVRDPVGRVLYQTNANDEVLQFTYNPADELLTLTDGKNQTTTWGYDSFGRVTNKLDALGTNVFSYQYDANDRLTNRFSAAKGNTTYKYDPIGNLTNVVYPASSNIVFRYDQLNRLTNMVDGIGSTVFGWTDGDQLASENGPWVNDAVSYGYNNARQRSALSLLQPNATPWVQNYDYDALMRLETVSSPAGEFSYAYNYSISSSDLVATRRNPGAISTSDVNNIYDGLARLTNTTLQSYFHNPTAQFGYAFDEGSQRTQQVFTAAFQLGYIQYPSANNVMNYTYDNIGQLKTAQGYESDGTTPRWHEQFGYSYDQAWNLNQRTNNALVQNFGVNKLNELTNATRSGTFTVVGTATEPKGGYNYWGDPAGVTNVTVSGTGLSSGLADLYLDGSWARTNATLANGTNSYTAVAEDTYGRKDTNSVSVNLPATNIYSYDLNGNLLSDGTRYFAYDDENQLTSVWVTNAWRCDFVYDGMLRRRISRDFTWQGSTWVKTNEVLYVYDGNLVIQERDANYLPKVTYTRGDDMSHSLQGAGGIGGLLARTDNGLMIAGDPNANAYYFSDGNGNVACLINTNGLVVAQYTYDPYGNILTMSGPLAEANTYRFSSKEWCGNAGLYYYGYRFYDSSLQRWLNRDPIQELGGLNLYAFISNVAVNSIDIFGLCNCDSPLWNPQFPNLFPKAPSKTPWQDFLKEAGKGLWNTYKDDIEKAIKNSPALGDVAESVGSWNPSQSKGNGSGFSMDRLGVKYNWTPNLSSSLSYKPDISFKNNHINVGSGTCTVNFLNYNF